MPCFSLQWIEQILIWLCVVGGVVALLRLLLPYVLSLFGVAGDVIMRAINIVIGVVIVVFVIVFVFDLISCLLGGGFGLHRL